MYIPIIANFLLTLRLSISLKHDILYKYKHRNNIIFKDRFDIALKLVINQNFWIHPESGLKMEMLISKANISDLISSITKNSIEKQKAPILFIHGSFHSAWCYSEYYMDFFNNLGHDCYSVSLRGTANTGMPTNDNSNKVTINQHISDMSFIINRLNQQYADEDTYNSKAPIIVAHSSGGLLAMKLLEIEEIRNKVSGVALLCSVPPSGNDYIHHLITYYN